MFAVHLLVCTLGKQASYHGSRGCVTPPAPRYNENIALRKNMNYVCKELHIVDIGGDVAEHAHVLRVEHHAADVLQRVVV